MHSTCILQQKTIKITFKTVTSSTNSCWTSSKLHFLLSADTLLPSSKYWVKEYTSPYCKQSTLYAGLASGGTDRGSGGFLGMGWGMAGYRDWLYTSTGSLMFHSTEEWMVTVSNGWLSLRLLTPRDDFSVQHQHFCLASFHFGNWNNKLRRVFLSWHQDRKCTLNRSLARCETGVDSESPASGSALDHARYFNSLDRFLFT